MMRCAPSRSRSTISTDRESLDAVAQAARRSRLRASALREPGQSLHREGALPGCGARLRSVRQASARTIAIAPSLQMRTIEAYQKGGFASLVLEGKQAFVERYAFGSAFWQQRTVADAPEVAAQLKSNQKDLAEYYHAQAQKSKKPEDYSAAARWYRAMLDSFPQDAEAPATRYLLGRSAVRIRSIRRGGEGIRAHGLRLSAAREVRRCRLRSAGRVSEARANDQRRVAGAVASAGHRKRS